MPPESLHEDTAEILKQWEREVFNLHDASKYCFARGVPKTTFYRHAAVLIEQDVLIPTGNVQSYGTYYQINKSTSVTPFVGYASKAVDLLVRENGEKDSLRDAVVMALYGPTNVARVASQQKVIPKDVERLKAHLEATRDRLLNVASLIDSMCRADLTDPVITVILNESQAVEKLTTLRKELDHD